MSTGRGGRDPVKSARPLLAERLPCCTGANPRLDGRPASAAQDPPAPDVVEEQRQVEHLLHRGSAEHLSHLHGVPVALVRQIDQTMRRLLDVAASIADSVEGRTGVSTRGATGTAHGRDARQLAAAPTPGGTNEGPADAAADPEEQAGELAARLYLDHGVHPLRARLYLLSGTDEESALTHEDDGLDLRTAQDLVAAALRRGASNATATDLGLHGSVFDT